MKITAITGSYRRGGVVDSAVDEILWAARACGAEVEKINLLDRRIEFCTNCRVCMQGEGSSHGKCEIVDDLESILNRLEASDVFILASPVNVGTVTALMKRFMERLGCYAFWPWGSMAPKQRTRVRNKRAVIVVSSAAPALIARFGTDCGKLLKKVSRLLGAGKVETLFLGPVCRTADDGLDTRAASRARDMGRKIVGCGSGKKN
jgi:NAD(P)H-dependent FMN reductase